MKNSYWWFLIAILLIGGGFMYFASVSQQNPQVTVEPTATSTPQGGASGITSAPSVREFTVEGKPFSFTPNEIRVKKGDTVRINFRNMEGFHDLVIDEFNVRTKQIQAGQVDTVEFAADKTGTFEYYCSVGNHRQMGMVGKLIVE